MATRIDLHPNKKETITILVDAAVQQVFRQKQDRMCVTLLIHRARQMGEKVVLGRLYSYRAIKHPTDPHDPEAGLKNALTNVLKLTAFSKRYRTEIWSAMRNQFDYIRFLTEYGRAVKGWTEKNRGLSL